MTQLYLRSQPTREAPVEFQRAVAAFARDHGGQTAEIVWIPYEVNCWQVKLYKRGDDPSRSQDPGTHFEPVLLHEWVDPNVEPNHPKLDRLANRNRPGYISLELEELGVSGLIQILEKGSLLSGRGDFQSAEHALQVNLKRQQEQAEKRKLSAKDSAVTRWKDKRRQALKIPFLPVEIELRSNKETK